MPAGRHDCRSQSNPRQNLEGEWGPSRSINLTIPETQSAQERPAPRPPRRNRGGRSEGRLRNKRPADDSKASTHWLQVAQDKVPRIRTPEEEGALDATETARSRMSRPQCANACLRKRKREPTRARGTDVGRAKKNTYTPRGATGQHSLPTPRWRSLMLKNTSRKPNHEGETEEKTGNNLRWKRGNP